MALVVRWKSAPGSLVDSVRAALSKLDPDLPLSGILSMDDVVSVSVGTAAVDGRCDRGIQFPRVVVGRDRNLRSDGVLGDATQAGDCDSDGAWGATGEHSELGGAARTAAGGAGRGDRTYGDNGVHASAVEQFYFR